MSWFSISCRRVVVRWLWSMISRFWMMLHVMVNVMVTMVTIVHHMSHVWILFHVVEWHAQVKY